MHWKDIGNLTTDRKAGEPGSGKQEGTKGGLAAGKRGQSHVPEVCSWDAAMGACWPCVHIATSTEK